MSAKIFIKHQKKTKNRVVNSYKELKTAKKDFDTVVLNLKKQKKDFKIVDNQQITVYNFNGNNYIVSSTSVA